YAFRNDVDLIEYRVGNFVEQLVQGYEVGTLDVPMRLLDLALQIDRVGQPIVEDGGHSAAAFLGEINFRLVHSLLLGVGGSALGLFCTARRRIPSALRF